MDRMRGSVSQAAERNCANICRLASKLRRVHVQCVCTLVSLSGDPGYLRRSVARSVERARTR